MPEHLASGRIVGIDMGVKRFATFSDGTFLEPLNSFKRHETALSKAQQSLSRKEKFSSNWRKAKRKVQCLHAKISNVRMDYLHKASHLIAKNHGIVCMEDLKVANMTQSGKGVKAKSDLNKAILDQGMFEFRRQVAYKAEWYGGQLIVVPPQYTSQTCPACGHISKNNRKTQADFRCVACGHAGHADHIAAMNILNRGMALLFGSSTEPERGTRAIAAHASA